MDGSPIRLLLVEDSPSDADLTIAALREAKVQNILDVVEDGVEALAYLRGEAPYTVAQRPDLILLDLNLPRMDGREVLAKLKADPILKTIPIVVLTTSAAEADILRAYELHANCYITKPVDFEKFLDVVRNIENFWLTVVKFPPREPQAQLRGGG
jgi:CheY-like chemotaxis protein